MSTDASSLERAFRAEAGVGALLGVDSDPEQLDLLRDESGKLPDDIFRRMRAVGRNGPGRPAGSKNKRNEKLAQLIVQQHGDPVLYMASIYSMPLDQMIELVLIADNTREREDRLLTLVEKCENMVSALLQTRLDPDRGKKVDEISNLLERITDAAIALKAKPGDAALKALGHQLAAAKAVAEYVHSKKPVEVNAQIGFDGAIIMPGAVAVGTQPVDQVMGSVADALNSGKVTIEQLQDMRIVEGEFEPVDDDAGDDE